MNINNIYFPDEIIDFFFERLEMEEKIQFHQMNRYTYNRYRVGIKNEIFNLINKNYAFFYDCIQKFNYSTDEKNILRKKSIEGINVVLSTSGSFYDLRFIFELIYLDRNIYDDYTFNYPIDHFKNGNNDVFRMMVNDIKKSISFNRYETIVNIEKNILLFSLRRTFKPILYKTHENKWKQVYIN